MNACIQAFKSSSTIYCCLSLSSPLSLWIKAYAKCPECKCVNNVLDIYSFQQRLYSMTTSQRGKGSIRADQYIHIKDHISALYNTTCYVPGRIVSAVSRVQRVFRVLAADTLAQATQPGLIPEVPACVRVARPHPRPSSPHPQPRRPWFSSLDGCCACSVGDSTAGGNVGGDDLEDLATWRQRSCPSPQGLRAAEVAAENVFQRSLSSEGTEGVPVTRQPSPRCAKWDGLVRHLQPGPRPRWSPRRPKVRPPRDIFCSTARSHLVAFQLFPRSHLLLLLLDHGPWGFIWPEWEKKLLSHGRSKEYNDE